MRCGFASIGDRYRNIAEFKFDETTSLGSDFFLDAKNEYELDLHIADVKIFDLAWLKQTFSNIDLVPLASAIAETLYTHLEWEVIEYDEEAVVTDSRRTFVFDFKNYDKLSAGASLLLVRDTQFTASTSDHDEFSRFRTEENDIELSRLASLRSHIDKEEGILVKLTDKLPKY